jgi:D-alanine-D-alanine ligase
MAQTSAINWGKVAVLAGGCSAEREVSLCSGEAVHRALCAQGVNAVLLDVQHDVESVLRAADPDRVFIALHGGDGENGVVQAVCQRLSLPYTGSGEQACALAMDKVHSKQQWQAMGLPTLPFVVLDTQQDLAAQVVHLGYPMAVKPVNGGSSLGVSCVSAVDDLAAAVALAARYDERVMVEPWVQGPELTVGVVSQKALPVIRVQAAAQFYDYNAKYNDNRTTYTVQTEPAAAMQALQAMALRAFDALGCGHWGRVDLLEDEQGRCYLLEINTVPGMTDHSLVPKAAAHEGMSYEQLVLAILASSMGSVADASH